MGSDWDGPDKSDNERSCQQCIDKLNQIDRLEAERNILRERLETAKIAAYKIFSALAEGGEK